MPDPQHDDGSDLEIGPVKLRRIPKKWMAFVVLVLTIIGLSWAYDKWRGPELISARQANATLQASMAEYGLHIAEPPEATAELMNDIRGKLTVQRYGDGCILLARIAHGKVKSKLVVDLDRDEHKQASHWLPSTTVYAAQREPVCLNPHPGRFDTRYGNRDGCWIEVWRRWPDSCEHYQMFNTCQNYWNSNQDGTPNVRWVRCAH